MIINTEKYLSIDRNENIVASSSDDSKFNIWRIVKPNEEESYVKIRSVSNGMYLRPTDFSGLYLDIEEDVDYQLWLIDPKSGLIQNKKTKQYLVANFEGNIRTSSTNLNSTLFENVQYSEWKLLLQN